MSFFTELKRRKAFTVGCVTRYAPFSLSVTGTNMVGNELPTLRGRL